METVLSKLKELAKGEVNFETLGECIREIPFDQLDYKPHIPGVPEKGQYGRNVLMMDPIECVVLRWPANAESAIHWHEGFYGYVIVLEGTCDNIEYELVDGQLRELKSMRGLAGGIVPEKDGVIHKLVNPSEEEAVTLHIYYPPLESFDKMQIFCTETNRMGVLNTEAKTASWKEPETSFHSITKDAFEYLSFENYKKSSHRINPIVPKPGTDLIYSMIKEYYDEQANQYDFFDIQHASRNNYTSKLNELLAEEFKQVDNLEKVLTLACGTGRRAVDIKDMTELDYRIVGVDLSPEMSAIAKEKGLEVYCSKWQDCDICEDGFSAATFMYAFGHLTCRNARLDALRKIAQHLRVGAPLFFDVFNLHDRNEWGPLALKTYEEYQLANNGYEKGDVFYRKNNGNAIAYLHYFEENEIEHLLAEAGFKVEYIKHIGYVKKAGEFLENDEEGALFVKAIKL